ncbi:MAG TPA: hypothetical protein ENN09_05835, partial [Planctomycetes bacterium]|nr:hypothetical protein [Planctomycetota bacterium]
DPDRARDLATEAEAALVRGDMLSAVRMLQQAIKLDTKNDTLRQRLAGLVTPEVRKLVDAGRKMLVNGQYSEAARAFRNAVDLDPSDEEARRLLETAEGKLLDKRNAINEIRQFIKEMRFDDVVKRWNELPPELREKNLEKQVERIKNVTIPARQLVTQADEANNGGRINEAVELYQKVLELDPNNQRAKEGLKEVQRKKSRADVLLKEGYEHFLARDFERAIDVWSNILRVVPGDEQVKKRLIEAHNEYISDLKGKEGGFSKIIRLRKGLVELEPSNREARAALERDEAKLKEYNELSERASKAFSRRRYGQAARYWGKLLDADPQNKKITASLKAARRKLRGRRIRNFIGFVVFLLVLAGGAVVYLENDMLRRAADAADKGNIEQAIRILERPRFDIPVLVFKKRHQDKLTELRRNFYRQQADHLRRSGDIEGAVKLLQQLIRIVGDDDKTLKKSLEREIHRTLADDLRCKATAAEEAGNFEEAASLYSQVSSKAAAAGDKDDSSAAAAKSRVLEILNTLARPEKTDPVERVFLIKEALGIDPLYPRLQELVRQGGYNFEAAAEKLRLGEEMLDAGNFEKAFPILEEAQKLDPSLTRARIMAAFARDNIYCRQKNMALITQRIMGRFSANPHWRAADRSKAYCMDVYEYPNRKGEEPRTSVSFLEAQSFCRQHGKRLCRTDEWEAACATSRRFTYPYGNAYVDGRCNSGAGTSKEPSGSRSGCVNAFGLYDMTGNVAEWTENRAAVGTDARHFINGGHWGSSPEEAACSSKAMFAPIISSVTVGFRCCLDLPLVGEE